MAGNSRSRPIYGIALLAGLLALPVVPACAQTFSLFGPIYRQSAPEGQQSQPEYQQSAPEAAQPPADDATVAGDDLLPPALRRQVVAYPTTEPAGTIIVDTAHTFLYLTLGDGMAMRYGIGVGRQGFTWSGVETISRKAEWPDWIPPVEMVARQPYLPRWVGGGPGNPLGARALYLGNTDYRIHGTNDPTTIGKHVSSGCIRLENADVIDLYSRVGVGAKVIVLPNGQRSAALGSAALEGPRGMPMAVSMASSAPDRSETLAASTGNSSLTGLY